MPPSRPSKGSRSPLADLDGIAGDLCFRDGIISKLRPISVEWIVHVCSKGPIRTSSLKSIELKVLFVGS